MKYNFNLTTNPSFAIWSNEDYFIYLENRIGQVGVLLKNAVIEHIKFLESIKINNNLKGNLQIRKLFYDDKGGAFECIVDYIIEKTDGNDMNIVLEESVIIEGNPTYFNIQVIEESTISDHFHKNHRKYYMNKRVLPWINEIDRYIYERNKKEDMKF